MLFLWFFHACRRESPRFLMVADHANYLTFEDPGAVNTVRRALKLAQAGDLLGAAETAGVEMGHAAAVSEGLRRGMRFSIGAEIDNDPRARPDAQNIVDAMRPDGIIRTVHFVPIHHPEKGPDWLWPFDNEEFASLYDVVSVDTLWELYMSKLLDDLEKLPAHIVGHFYVPATLGHWPAQKRLEEHEDACSTSRIAAAWLWSQHTVSLSGFPRRPQEEVLGSQRSPCARPGLAGSASRSAPTHTAPKTKAARSILFSELLDDARINEIVFPVAGRLARVALRATREHLEAQAQARRQPSAPGSSITGYSRAELGLPEEAEGAARAARGARAVGPKKRASDSSRTSKSPASGSAPAATTSRRTTESASSASKAKTARSTKPARGSEEGKSRREKPATKRPDVRGAHKRGESAGRARRLRRRPPPKKAPAKKTAQKHPAAKKPAPKKTCRQKDGTEEARRARAGKAEAPRGRVREEER